MSYYERVAAGLCRSCPKPARLGRVTCLACALRDAERDRARYWRQKAARAVENWRQRKERAA